MIGAGSVLGSFSAKLGLDTNDYAKGIINAQGMNRVFGQSFTQFVSNPLLGSIELMKNVGVAVGRASAKHLELAETLQRLSQQTGASEQFLLALTKRLEVAGYTGDIAAKSMATFGKNILELHAKGSGPLKDVADLLGVQIDANERVEVSMGRLLDQIHQLPTAYQRSAAAGKVFGEEMGPKLLNAIGGGSAAMAQMQQEATQLGFRVDSVGNDALAGMNTQLGYMKQAIEGIKFNAINSFLTGFAGTSVRSTEGITQLTNRINNELTPAMERFGEASADGMKNLAEGLPGIINLLGDVVRSLNAVGEAWDGSWAEALWSWNNSNMARAIGPMMFPTQLTPGQQRLHEMSPLQQKTPLQSAYASGTFMSGF